MKHSQRFDRAINALVKGYLNNTLAKGVCTACAVGNMVAASCGYQFYRSPTAIALQWDSQQGPVWNFVFRSDQHGQELSPKMYYGEAKRQIDATGYTWGELARVEKAFESNTQIHHFAYRRTADADIDADQYAGLMAVVDVLCDIEGIPDAAEYKAMFTKPVAA